MRFSSVVTAVLLGGVFLSSCSPTPLPLGTNVGALGLKKSHMTAALVMPDAQRSSVAIQDVPCGGEYKVSIGAELERGGLQAFAQVFDSIELIADKNTAMGNYDVLIEFASPQINTEGHCATRRLLWILFPIYPFLNPSDRFEAQSTLMVTALDRNGQTILSETYKSETHTQDTLLAKDESRASAISIVMQAALSETLQNATRGIANSSQFRSYARRTLKKSGDRSQGTDVASSQSSDVDDPPKAVMAWQKNHYAVVIGIEQYRQRLPKVDFAARDASVMREYLTKTLGYPDENVIIALNEHASKSDLEKYIEQWLPNHVEKDSTVFVYYSGHGAPNPKTGEGFLVPYDGDPTFLEVTGYSLKRLYENLGKLPAREVLVVLDSCFSGAGGRSVIAKGTRPVVVSAENPALLSGKTLVLSASAGDQVSNTYDTQAHGLLTYFFLRGLQGEADLNKDKTIDLQELFAYVKPAVQRTARRDYNTDQVPQLLGSLELLKDVKIFENNKGIGKK